MALKISLKRFCLLFLLLATSSLVSFAQKPSQLQVLSIESYSSTTYDHPSYFITPTHDSGVVMQIRHGNSLDTLLCPNADTGTVFIKYDMNFNKVWTKCLSVTGTQYSFETLLEQDSAYYMLAGNCHLSATNSDFVIQKNNASDSMLWRNTFGGSLAEKLYHMMPTADSGYLMGGESFSDDGNVGVHYGSSTMPNIWVMKADSTGNSVYSTVLGGTGNDSFAMVVPMPDNSVYVLGSTTSSDSDCVSNHGGQDVFVARLDSMGNKVWTMCLGGSATDNNPTAVADGNGGIYLSAYTASTNGDLQNLNIGAGGMWLVHIDSMGNATHRWLSDVKTVPETMVLNADGTMWLGGWFLGIPPVYYGGNNGIVSRIDTTTGNVLGAAVLGGAGNDYIAAISVMHDGNVLAIGKHDDAPANIPYNYAGNGIFMARIAPSTTGVAHVNNEVEQVIVYPNPANSEITISGITANGTLRITDITGKTVHTQTVQAHAKTTIDISSLTAGVYFAGISDGEKTMQVVRFVKN